MALKSHINYKVNSQSGEWVRAGKTWKWKVCRLPTLGGVNQ